MSFFRPLRWGAGLASTLVAGLMSAADKAKLDGLAAGAAVVSVFGRSGAVVAAVGDYVTSEIDNDSSVSGTTLKDALNALLGRAHATLGSLGADDHTQYALVTGTRAFTGLVTATGFAPTPAAPAFSASISLDANTQHHDIGKLTANIAISFTNYAIGKSLTFSVKQDATGNRTLTVTPPGGYTLDRDFWADDNPQMPANTRTLYTIVFYAQDGANYCAVGKSFRT